ncbi:hypothetical protein TREMEDRAFT_64527 [Tremella mesenterica DSM 1558]|uniref:uncharacterized protein n=1 Tax=Tremella mesenterica (strain ATCC 24925 / CBS 8224 / DSM 1558 / NBRC 9311 / NRRL Y-6157 / RJB 2259-6 / UBC 559-6) TaxID=578456 RepID=UPI0003F48FA9|nr:uncharacterized protein TREMEDRAFT_64527 [Tremella mesenterica DSM 1558]EIW67279.1 hypothetical protein TREMEDRAFT_64527 [Tremella mesenterica DSM 1558]
MSPIPPPSELPHLLASAQRRIQDMKTFQLPRLADCEPSMRKELCEELREDLERVVYTIRLCREISLSLPSSSQNSSLSTCSDLEVECQALRITYRQAILNSRRNVRKSTLEDKRLKDKDERYELRSDTREDLGDAQLQAKTNEVTEVLGRTARLMQVELERSVLSVQMLESSTQTLRSTGTLYDRYTSLLQTSTGLVKAIERADKYDRLILLLALLLFLLTVGYIVKRRVLDKAVGGVGWWFRSWVQRIEKYERGEW